MSEEPKRITFTPETIARATEDAEAFRAKMEEKYPGYASDPEIKAAYDAEYAAWRARHQDVPARDYTASNELMARIKAMKERMAAASANMSVMSEPVVQVVGSLTEFNKAIRGGESVEDVKAAMKCSNPPVGCGKDLGPDYQFRDLVSTKEYQITALCQDCQDRVFAVYEDESDEAWDELQAQREFMNDERPF